MYKVGNILPEWPWHIVPNFRRMAHNTYKFDKVVLPNLAQGNDVPYTEECGWSNGTIYENMGCTVYQEKCALRASVGHM